MRRLLVLGLLLGGACSHDDGSGTGMDAGTHDARPGPDVVLPTGTYPAPGLLAAPAPSPECSGNDVIHVAVDGPDGDGSEASPRTDWHAALADAMPGQTLRFRAGTYVLSFGLETARGGTENARICLAADDPTNRPVLERQSPYDGHLLGLDHAWIVVDGFVLDGGYVPRERNDGSQNLARIRGQGVILRNSELRRNRRTALHVDADGVLLENLESHHHLRGSFTDQQDAHAISAGGVRDLVIRHADLHHVTGDCFQINPDTRYDEGDVLWDAVLLEHTRMWTSALTADEAAGTGWLAGESPGENAIDTKTFEHSSSYPTAPFRPTLTLVNVMAHGFDANGYISRRSAFNIKHECDWIFDGVTTFDNQFAFRVRGPWEAADTGGARVVIRNLLAFGNGTPAAESAVFRVEREIPLTIHHATFFDNHQVFRHTDNPDGTGWDESALDVRSSLFDGTIPDGIEHPSNRVVTASDFVDAAAGDFRLVSTSGAVDGCDSVSVTRDLTGAERDALPDCGAYERSSTE